MSQQKGNYCAFYVSEPFNQSSLGAHATKDFVYYNLLRSWKGADASFPFIDSHSSTYSVRDGSDWEKTLKPRLHQRLKNSKNIILFLSSSTINSRAIREEVDYAINVLSLPVIVIYPEFENKEDIHNVNGFTKKITNLWDLLPMFRDSKHKVPVMHIPLKKELVQSALKDKDFFLGSDAKNIGYYYN
ncbi:TIR domain-containing protein [Enterobacter cloacae]|uniref:Thoeris protein ThsB TIR-like domain-containing protein n=2 Tax=Enterobacter cloacae complex TaxID=354276 RepID=A0A144V0L2_ENTCL|nr:TIR domain-containing protein [Enterobacter cloacae]CZW46697.1 Uncharacterised protein [Enterobacter cloacae]